MQTRGSLLRAAAAAGAPALPIAALLFAVFAGPAYAATNRYGCLP